jgi:hypothetical protein
MRLAVHRWLIVALLPLLGVLPTQSTEAVTVGQLDTFEDGTTQGWVINLLGMGAPPAAALPVNIPSGGPSGADDNFLRLTALGGSGAGSRLTALNSLQWAGDYLAAGIGSLTMNVNNLGTTDLFLRLVFENPTVGPPDDIAFSTDAVFVPGGSGWVSVVFSIVPSALTAGLGSVTDALSTTTVLRLYHSEAPTFPNPATPPAAVVAQLGVDNILAVAAPATPVSEPVPLASLAAGFAGLIIVISSRRRCDPRPGA